jgi:hypothetical protein
MALRYTDFMLEITHEVTYTACSGGLLPPPDKT